jgi:hypothetical protein
MCITLSNAEPNLTDIVVVHIIILQCPNSFSADTKLNTSIVSRLVLPDPYLLQTMSFEDIVLSARQCVSLFLMLNSILPT